MPETLRPGQYEGHDCFPEEEPPDVVATVAGERIYELEYVGIPDVLAEVML